jgi:integrase
VGSITSYETAAGKRYRVRYRKPDRAQTDKRGFTTKRDAELFLASVEVSKARGEYVDSTAGRSTIGSLATEWLKHHGHMKPSASRPLEIAWRLHVSPRWANVRVADVRFTDVQAWVSEQKGGATTVLRSFGVLASILDVAVRDRRILSNPARGVNLPRKVGKARVYLSHSQVQLLASNSGPRGTLVDFLASTGLRWGEVTALQVGDLDTARRRINVQRNAVMVGGAIIVGTPKSHESRSVPYPSFLTDRLADESKDKSRVDLLFGDGINFLRPPDPRNGWWVRAIAASRELDPDFPESLTRHDLRHTAASLAVSAGANVKAVQRMLGHASAAMTLDVYADLFDDDLDNVADALNSARLASNVGKVWANDSETKP